MLRIPVAQFPDIVPPRVQVTAFYPGASAAVVEAAIAQPLEAQIVGVDKMIYMKSTSGNDGSYNLTVSFAVGTNPDTATVNVNNRVQTALPQLPQAVQVQGLTVIKRSAAILQFMNLYSETGKLSPVYITSYATINVLDELARVPGVGQALLFGKLNYSMRIWFDTQRLTSLNLSPSDVVEAVRAQNVQAPVGRIGARPVSDDQQFQLNVQTQGTLTTPSSSRRSCCAPIPTARCCASATSRGSRWARRTPTPRRASTASRRLALRSIWRPTPMRWRPPLRSGRTLERLSARFPEDLKARVVYDSTVFVTDTIREVLITVGEAFILVVIVVFLFLGSIRATIIPAVAGTGQPDRHLRLPACARLLGQYRVTARPGAGDRHRGRRRHRRGRERRAGDAGEPAHGAARGHPRGDAPDHRPDLSPSAWCCWSVFVPVAFIPGISGQLFRQFAVTISVAMLISAVNALTLSPALCAIFLRHEIPTRGPIYHVLHAINLVRDGYARVVQRLIRVAILALPLVVLIGGGIFGLARITPTSFLPEEDQGAFFLNIQLPDGASVARTSETVRRVEAMLKAMPQVQDVFVVVGFSLLDAANSSNAAFAVAKLKPFEDRPAAADSAQALIRQVSAGASRSAPPTSSPSTCRRSSACRPAAASSTSSRRSRGRIRCGWAP
jgi:multidrug efflux pump subunit AcrB